MTQTKQIRFFAIRPDLISMLELVESGGSPVVYFRGGRFLTPEPQEFLRGEDIPDLGVCRYPSSTICDRFLVCESGTVIYVRRVDQSDDVTSYHIGQRDNPASVVFWPGGLWKGETLLNGSVATAS